MRNINRGRRSASSCLNVKLFSSTFYLALLFLCTRTIFTTQLLKRWFPSNSPWDVSNKRDISRLYEYARECGTRNSHDRAVMPEQLHNIKIEVEQDITSFFLQKVYFRLLYVHVYIYIYIYVENAKVATKVLAICIIYWVLGVESLLYHPRKMRKLRNDRMKNRWYTELPFPTLRGSAESHIPVAFSWNSSYVANSTVLKNISDAWA